MKLVTVVNNELLFAARRDRLKVDEVLLQGVIANANIIPRQNHVVRRSPSETYADRIG